MKAPTRDELEAIPVSDEEQLEYLRNIQRVEHALDKAHIPRTLDWALVLLSYAAQRCAIQGMSREFFMQFSGTTFGAAVEGLDERRVLPAEMPTLEHLPAKVKRLQSALMRGKVPLDGEASVYIVGAAARTCVRYCVPAELWHELSEAAFTDAEKRLHALAGRTGNTA